MNIFNPVIISMIIADVVTIWMLVKYIKTRR